MTGPNPYDGLIERLRVLAHLASTHVDRASLEQAAEALSRLTRDVEELTEVLSILLRSCDRGPPALHDGCGTTIISAPHPEAMRAARATLTRLSRPPELGADPAFVASQSSPSVSTKGINRGERKDAE